MSLEDARNPTREPVVFRRLFTGVQKKFSRQSRRVTIVAVSTFQEPGWFTRNVFNKMVGGLTAMGISLMGSRVLEVKGRKSGEWRTTPVNLLEVDGQQYLVAPRGNTPWVRNMRVAGGGRLKLGRKTEDFKSTEILDDSRAAILRAYLKKWKWEVGVFFDGVGPDSTDEQLLAVAPDHPVFKIDS
jgi:deazaflavin-dependent oxidoreductase (nitroreductase family)